MLLRLLCMLWSVFGCSKYSRIHILLLSQSSAFFKFNCFLVSENTGGWKFQTILWIYTAICLASFILQLAVGAAILFWLPLICAFFMALTLRLHITKTHSITECGSTPGSACLGEFCCGFWCWYCSVAQSK